MRNFVSNSGARIRGASLEGEQFPHSEMTRRIIGCAIAVHKALGPGYLESVYENALAHELRKQGLGVERQKTVKVMYDGIAVGEHRLDLLVEDTVLIELKSVEELSRKHVAQVISTMKAAGAKVALLMNFNEAQMVHGIRRIVL